MRLLLGSGGITTEARRAAWVEELSDFLGDVDRVLFVPWAVGDAQAARLRLIERGLGAGKTLIGIESETDPRAAVREAEAVFVTGGNTFRLLAALEQHGMIDLLRGRVDEGLPYVGVSAGTNIACPTIATTNDMPIVWPRSNRGLGLVPFQINAHFVSGVAHYAVDGALVPYGGETREDRLREYLEMNDRPVLALHEGAILRVEAGSARLRGPFGAVWLSRGRDAEPLPPGSELSHLLAG